MTSSSLGTSVVANASYCLVCFRCATLCIYYKHTNTIENHFVSALAPSFLGCGTSNLTTCTYQETHPFLLPCLICACVWLKRQCWSCFQVQRVSVCCPVTSQRVGAPSFPLHLKMRTNNNILPSQSGPFIKK